MITVAKNNLIHRHVKKYQLIKFDSPNHVN